MLSTNIFTNLYSYHFSIRTTRAQNCCLLLQTEKWNGFLIITTYIYALVFFLPAFAFLYSLTDLESCALFSLSVTIYYFLIENLTSDKSLFAFFISDFIPEWPATLFLPSISSFILKWLTTSFFPTVENQRLVTFFYLGCSGW